MKEKKRMKVKNECKCEGGEANGIQGVEKDG